MRRSTRTIAAAMVGVWALGACTSSGNDASKPTTLAVNGGTTTTTTAAGASSAVTTSSVPGAPTVPPTAAPTTSTTVAPTSTVPPGSPATVTISRGGFIAVDKGKSCTTTTCKYVQIDSSGWTKNQPLSITCYSASGSSGPYTKYADKSGNLSASTVCFFGNVTNVHVEINGVSSNVVTPWKDW